MRSVTILLALAVLAAACGNTNTAGPVDQVAPGAAKLTVKQRYAHAKPVAVRYLTALAHGKPQAAQAVVGVSGFKQLNSLSQLTSWFSAIPARQLRVKTTAKRVPDMGAIGVKVSMTARLGPAPLTSWVKLGERVILVQDQDAGWRVIGDITNRKAMHSRIYGLSLIHQPQLISSPTVTVVYADTAAIDAAQPIARTAQKVVRMLHRKYGGGTASRHPLIYVVSDLHQGEKLSGVTVGRKETPAGWQVGSFAYIDYPVWLTYDIVDQDSTIAHELTHVATEQLLAGAPHSLLEGIAMYQEEKFLNSLGLRRPMDLVNAYYQHGFPSADIWGLRYSDWGQTNLDAIQAAYEDGQAMTAVIMEQHGGVPALGRLAAGFRRLHEIRYSATQVEAVFQQALGVSFDTVVAEAHAYAAAHGS